MTEQINALATISPNNDNIGRKWCSIVPTGDRSNDAKIFAALNNPDERLANHINKKIAVKDVLVEIREILDEETGVCDVVPRVVLIADDGTSYQATSKGIYNALCNAFAVFGNAPWDPALLIEVKQTAVKNGSMLTFNVLG